jgi:hypothetical protein
MYAPPNQQMMQAYQHQPYQSSAYPPPQGYEQSQYSYAEDYGTAVRIPKPSVPPDEGNITNTQKSSQPYSTPATSPPTPSRNEVRVTRSGAGPRGGGKAAAPSTTRNQPAAKKKTGKDRPKAVKKSPHLPAPMSEISKDSQIPVVDIGTYVHRSSEERIREVATGKIPGKIKRPMNAFMLYRKAYQNRAKEWCSQHNHQIVSQVCGESWPLEPERVRAQFTEWAKIERDNHQKAHPSYKFTPSKPNKAKVPPPVAKRGYEDDEDEEDPDDPDWRGSKRRKPTPLDDDEYQPASRQMYPPLNGGGYNPGPNRSAFHATNPGKPMPMPYDPNASANGSYYSASMLRNGPIEDIIHTKTASPGSMMQQHHNQGYARYEGGNLYAPPSAHQQQVLHSNQAAALAHHQHQQRQYLEDMHVAQQQHYANQQQQRVLDPNLMSPPQQQQHFTQRLDPALMPAPPAQNEAAGLESVMVSAYSPPQQALSYPHQLDPAHGGGADPAWNGGYAEYGEGPQHPDDPILGQLGGGLDDGQLETYGEGWEVKNFVDGFGEFEFGDAGAVGGGGGGLGEEGGGT